LNCDVVASGRAVTITPGIKLEQTSHREQPTVDIITAIFQNGKFTPQQAVELADGTRVRLRVEVAELAAATKRCAFSPLVPDEVVESDERGASIELAMPPGVSARIKSREGRVLLPDPPIVAD